jgi:hypothetical protein
VFCRGVGGHGTSVFRSFGAVFSSLFGSSLAQMSKGRSMLGATAAPPQGTPSFQTPSASKSRAPSAVHPRNSFALLESSEDIDSDSPRCERTIADDDSASNNSSHTPASAVVGSSLLDVVGHCTAPAGPCNTLQSHTSSQSSFLKQQTCARATRTSLSPSSWCSGRASKTQRTAGWCA